MVHHIEEGRVTQEIVVNSQRLMILDVYADWCIPCQMLSPILAELDKKYNDLEIYKLNADESENFTTLNNITSIPTLIFYKDGEEKDRIVGVASMDDLEKIVATKKVTLIDDGTIENAWGSSVIDDEGNETKKNVLIEKGIIKNYLVDQFNSKKMNTKLIAKYNLNYLCIIKKN